MTSREIDPTYTDVEIPLDPEGSLITIGSRANRFERGRMTARITDSVYDEAMIKSLTNNVVNFIILHGESALIKTSEDFRTRGGKMAELAAAVEPYISPAQELLRAAQDAAAEASE